MQPYADLAGRGRLDRADAHLAVALCRVRVAEGELGVGDLHRQEEPAAGDQVAAVEVPADELYDGTKYADRHTAHITKKDGSTVRMEVYAIGDLAPDGRFRRVEEVTLMLHGSDSDRTIGNAR
jgi:hypothetical protein